MQRDQVDRTRKLAGFNMHHHDVLGQHCWSPQPFTAFT
ncbi:hypothetical protein PF002_g2340 [Phytophthora fragariae]|uniref:Uncharacterized protein n=1 Tax=Phytophthora fragariae TaxID=53985 RepID=A0A6A3UMZ3_9STRA|nr:hypothetical protein PF003_g459 [Phytophthora fragariae]KAE9152930.1 hypothetical protein PF006_g2898 [Phytophthora fragariae]KAE9255444.1 hypothetical protein PF002_g2340 [Phytophthora fragariae]